MDMHRILLITALAIAALPAQEIVKIAPEKEAELKGRVAKFWDGFVSGKYRSSDAFVSDEAKEEFFSWPKKKIKGYTIDRVLYTEGGKSAKVVTLVDTTMAMMGVGAMEIKQPVETWWREEEGGWFWFQPKNQMRETPFGKMESNSQSGEAPLIATGEINLNPNIKELMSSVKPDRQMVRFVMGEENSETVYIQNGMPGIVTVTMDTPIAEDITFELTSKNIPRGGKTGLVIRYKPVKKAEPDAETVKKVVRVGVAQTGMMYPIQVLVEPKKKD